MSSGVHGRSPQKTCADSICSRKFGNFQNCCEIRKLGNFSRCLSNVWRTFRWGLARNLNSGGRIQQKTWTSRAQERDQTVTEPKTKLIITKSNFFTKLNWKPKLQNNKIWQQWIQAKWWRKYPQTAKLLEARHRVAKRILKTRHLIFFWNVFLWNLHFFEKSKIDKFQILDPKSTQNLKSRTLIAKMLISPNKIPKSPKFYINY